MYLKSNKQNLKPKERSIIFKVEILSLKSKARQKGPLFFINIFWNQLLIHLGNTKKV